MKQNVVFAVLLIAIGFAALFYQGISYKTREKAMDLGSLQVTTEKNNNIPIPPIIGMAALIGGVILLARSTKKV